MCGNNMENLVTVIIPVYNSEKYLKKCIESVIEQKYKRLEIIIIDDGSTDKSAEICEEYLEKDSRIKFIHQDNKGVSSARNAGIKIATGKYICFIDSDDYVDAEYISDMLRNLEQSNADLSICTLSVEYALGKWKKIEIEKVGLLNKEEGLISLFSRQGMSGGPYCKLYKTEILHRYGICFNENIKMCEDNLFCYEYIRRCNKIWCFSEALYFYCYNPNSASNKAYIPKRIDDSQLHFKAYKEIEKTIKDEGELVVKYFLTIRAEKWIRLVYKYNLYKHLCADDTQYIRKCILAAYQCGIEKELKMKKGSYIMGRIMVFCPSIAKLLCETKRLYWRRKV